MKKLIILLLLTTTTTILSQSAKLGLKGGLNFGSVGDLSLTSEFINSTISSENQLGYHIGAYGNLKFLGLFIQPELVYTKVNTEFESDNINGDYSLSKIDIPVLIGFDIAGPLNIKAGPAFQLIVDNEINGLDIAIEDPENNFTIGYQIGAGIQLGRLGLDLRYEGAFAENNALSDTNIGFELDTRPSQWIVSLSYMLGKGDNN